MLKVLFPWKQNNTKKVLFAMEQVVNGAGPSADEQPPGELPLLPCHVCNRTFLPKPLKKHVPICEQTARRKRKPFDSLKQRVEGTDMAPFYQKSYLKKSNPEISSQAQAGDVYGNNKQSKWREKHVELQNTIKNAKGTKPDMNTNLPSNNHTSITPNRKVGHLTVNQTSSNERCPVCDRSFGPKAFDRHVEFCKEQKNRVQVHKSPAVVQQAKERLEAGINYRVPPLRQSKRNLIRDKYSPSSQTNLLHRSNTIVSGKSTTSLASSVTTMLPNRRQPTNNNEKIIERNNKKDLGSKVRLDRAIGDCGDTKQAMKNDNNGNKSFTKPTNTVNYDPFEQAHLQLMELIEDDNLTPSPTYSTTTMSTHSTPNVEFRPFVTTSSTPKTAIVKSNGKRASVIDPPYSFQDNRASRDLDKEFELLESLVNNNLESEPKERSSLRCRDFGEDVDAIDPNLINEQDNLFIPDHLPSDDNSPSCNAGHVRSVERVREWKRTVEPLEPRLSRRPTRLAVKPTTRALPLIGPDQVRLAPDGSSAESQAGEGRRASPRSFQTNKTKSKMKIDFSPESLKNKNSRMIGTGSLSKQNGLEFGKVRAEGLEELTPRQETVNLNITPTAEELYPDNPAMYEEFRKYEEMYRREKEGKGSSSKKQRKKTSDFGINIEDTSKTYEDSTYGRKQQMDEQDLDQVEELVRNMLPTATTPGERLPKFCHECGNKYPVATAKFCVECGIKRLVL